MPGLRGGECSPRRGRRQSPDAVVRALRTAPSLHYVDGRRRASTGVDGRDPGAANHEVHRGAKLEEAAGAGELVGLTRDRALIAVVVPMVQAWVEHIVDQNWSRILQSAASAEDLIAAEARLTTLDDIDDAPDADTDAS